MRYEQWGRPVQGCASFDDRSEVRKFNLELTLRNDSDTQIEEWYPVFYANSGRELLTCFYLYWGVFGALDPDGEMTVTFASFCETSEYVSEMRLTIFEEEYRRCFSPVGALINCP